MNLCHLPPQFSSLCNRRLIDGLGEKLMEKIKKNDPLKAVWVGGVQITGEWQDPSLTKGLTWLSSRYRYTPPQHRRCPRSDPGWRSWQSRPTGPVCTWTRPSPGCSAAPTTTRATSSATSWISSSLKHYFYLMFNFIIWAKNDETFFKSLSGLSRTFLFQVLSSR